MTTCNKINLCSYCSSIPISDVITWFFRLPWEINRGVLTFKDVFEWFTMEDFTKINFKMEVWVSKYLDIPVLMVSIRDIRWQLLNIIDSAKTDSRTWHHHRLTRCYCQETNLKKQKQKQILILTGKITIFVLTRDFWFLLVNARS